jgi:hypothetical protein
VKANGMANIAGAAVIALGLAIFQAFAPPAWLAVPPFDPPGIIWLMFLPAGTVTAYALWHSPSSPSDPLQWLRRVIPAFLGGGFFAAIIFIGPIGAPYAPGFGFKGADSTSTNLGLLVLAFISPSLLMLSGWTYTTAVQYRNKEGN